MLVLTSIEKIIVVLAYAVAFILTMNITKVVFSQKEYRHLDFRLQVAYLVGFYFAVFCCIIGDIIFFEWANGTTGDRDNLAEHVGIVEKVDNGRVYTIESNLVTAVEKESMILIA